MESKANSSNLSTHSRISAGAVNFLAGIIDYAGLFPPAKLPIAEAIGQYLQHQDHPHKFLLARFVLPMTQLGEFASLVSQGNAKSQGAARLPIWHLSLIAKAAANAPAQRSEFKSQVQQILAFIQSLPQGTLAIDSVEIPLPEDAYELAGAEACSFAQDFVHMLEPLNAEGKIRVFFEHLWKFDPESVLDGLRIYNSSHPARPLAIKLRTGGLTPQSVPSVTQLANVIDLCRRADVAFKATAGLHCPLPNDNADVGTRMHGFLNVFSAGMLSHAKGLDASRLENILAATDPRSFSLTGQGLTYQDGEGSLSLSNEELTRLRRVFALSFGSCSFLEPVEHLTALGILA